MKNIIQNEKVNLQENQEPLLNGFILASVNLGNIIIIIII
jgi:hypothetical protein